MKVWNKDIKRRDEIIFGKYDPNEYRGGIRYFTRITVDKVRQLVDEGFMSTEDRQNFAPSVGELIKFAEKWNKNYVFSGYAVIDTRDDYRVSIDTIDSVGGIGSNVEQREFYKLIKDADEKEIEYGHAWWD